MVFPPTIEI